MTLRELLRASLEITRDLDQQVKVRIVKRDADGCVETIKLVPIVGYRSNPPCIVVENFHLEEAKELPA